MYKCGETPHSFNHTDFMLDAAKGNENYSDGLKLSSPSDSSHSNEGNYIVLENPQPRRKNAHTKSSEGSYDLYTRQTSISHHFPFGPLLSHAI